MTKSGMNTVDYLYDKTVEWRDKAERYREERDAYKGLVEQWKKYCSDAFRRQGYPPGRPPEKPEDVK